LVKSSLVEELKHQAMNQKAINYEILFFTNSRFPGKHVCKKKCSNASDTCPFSLPNTIRLGKRFLISLISSNEKSPVENIDASLKIIPAENFVHLSVGDAFDAIEDQKAIDPHSFFPLKHFN
jgi:hypothetical protein